MSILRSAARRLAGSPLFRRGRSLWEENQKDFDIPGRQWSKWDKLAAGSYLILTDYAEGVFPPRFPDRQTVYEDEARIADQPGATLQEQLIHCARKPFWGARVAGAYLPDFVRILAALERCGVHPPARLLELGSGSGWTAEWLAVSGYDVTATSIRADDRELVEARAASIRARGLPALLDFRECPMEEAAERLRNEKPFQAVFVYEALHHAFSWKETIASVRDLLPVGGWFLICKEPNVLHTFISYRVAKLQRWHEVGIPRGPLLRALREHGFDRVEVLHHKANTLVHPHWIAARRGP